MRLSEKFSMNLSNYIKKTLPNKTEEELEIIRYGTEVLFMNITKLPIILAVGYILGLFWYTLYTLIIFGILRRFVGGIHARKSITCLISTGFIILGAVYISLAYPVTIIEKLFIFIVVLYVFFKYAPADTEEKPYLDKSVRQNLKIKSILTACVYFFLSIFIKNLFFSNVFLHILWIEAILICPITYKILNRRYNNYEYYRENI
ncbi:accessory gene regulator B family protein [Clostridium tagluense]|uniref:accessory gene regulator B family protein n=1 Tax=Clostridium tagluense TaxID=360422 RepID=UPI001C0ABB11|nr:accessory gene regulator B family protein [Clostridium tagluense]MBU3129926.1 accessory gene regulator B family protein [Clostridium tagluense]MCB2311941.1 accessory gene regulator B family protein [Clostridium tagluense]MCB2318148.1 accessory gene regulator B family protein [Clostridium tagluense]MCB2323315.1 accessory gene regulator B family protein [Clostridium tagluense]MCB2327932.1 accessory gene regulator B family protein [Clostridium tagluense]